MEACASRHQLCDVVLIAGTRRIPAHRLVLSAASDYFAAMFMNNVRESTMDEVEIKDVDPDALDSLIHYTYTGKFFAIKLSFFAIILHAVLFCANIGFSNYNFYFFFMNSKNDLSYFGCLLN